MAGTRHYGGPDAAAAVRQAQLVIAPAVTMLLAAGSGDLMKRLAAIQCAMSLMLCDMVRLQADAMKVPYTEEEYRELGLALERVTHAELSRIQAIADAKVKDN